MSLVAPGGGGGQGAWQKVQAGRCSPGRETGLLCKPPWKNTEALDRVCFFFVTGEMILLEGYVFSFFKLQHASPLKSVFIFLKSHGLHFSSLELKGYRPG